MVELRWRRMFHGSTVKVLQYRVWKVRLDASGAITPLPAPIEWTDWIDVPNANQGEPRATPDGAGKQET